MSALFVTIWVAAALALGGCQLLPSAHAEQEILVAAPAHERAPVAAAAPPRGLPPPASSPGSTSALLLAAVLAVGAAAWWRHRATRGAAPAEAIETLAQSSLGGKARALWLRADQRNLLVAVTPQAVRVLDRWPQASAGAAAVRDPDDDNDDDAFARDDRDDNDDDDAFARDDRDDAFAPGSPGSSGGAPPREQAAGSALRPAPVRSTTATATTASAGSLARPPRLRSGVRSGLRAARPSKSRGRFGLPCPRGDQDPR